MAIRWQRASRSCRRRPLTGTLNDAVGYRRKGMAAKSSFLERVLGRIERLDPQGLQTVVQRLARERNFLETLFNTIEDGVLVVDETGRILYLNQAVSLHLGQPAEQIEGEPLGRFMPE